jgi:hypothetical protein
MGVIHQTISNEIMTIGQLYQQILELRPDGNNVADMATLSTLQFGKV